MDINQFTNNPNHLIMNTLYWYKKYRSYLLFYDASKRCENTYELRARI